MVGARKLRAAREREQLEAPRARLLGAGHDGAFSGLRLAGSNFG